MITLKRFDRGEWLLPLAKPMESTPRHEECNARVEMRHDDKEFRFWIRALHRIQAETRIVVET